MSDVKYVHPEFIWLQPWCTDCENSDVQADTGRCWSPDDPWGKCDECGRPAIKYEIVKGQALDQ